MGKTQRRKKFIKEVIMTQEYWFEKDPRMKAIYDKAGEEEKESEGREEGEQQEAAGARQQR